uniref:GCK domain-containing protein n=1 Tax=Hordeum vulgare subsp. vulgare TaxID=112509 RepID=A0A8I7B1S9_HORVV
MAGTYAEASRAGAKCDKRLVIHHVANGGCLDEFNKAMENCRGRYTAESSIRDKLAGKRVVDVEACVKATAALRDCFADNPAAFKHQYLRRMDEGLDQDTNPSPDDISSDERDMFRWWTGMRRS